MSNRVISNSIINSPFEEPRRHFRFDEEGITDEVVNGRRTSSYFVPIPRAKKEKKAASNKSSIPSGRKAASKRISMCRDRTVPVLEKIRAWLDVEGQVVLPRSPMGLAIQYAQNQWSALTTYATQGFLNIDNNASERALKRVAIGRKNWLFAGHDAAAENHARLWSLIASAERYALDPQRYLTSVLAKIGQTPTDDLEQFLPDMWKREDTAERREDSG